MGTKVKPYKTSQDSKKQQVAQMFDNISHRYDFLNHLLSLNIDKLWRNKVVRMATVHQPKKVLDVATGTADLALALRKSGAQEIIGVDISEGMLNIGRAKVKQQNLDALIRLDLGDSEALPYDEDYFDLITVAFGVRNFENLDTGLAEIYRVLRPGGQVLILEFSQPGHAVLRSLYRFYSNYILPQLGKLVSRDTDAYTYLPESVDAFPYGQNFVDHLQSAGFQQNEFRPVTFGVATIYQSFK